MKTCTKCKENKDLIKFSKRKKAMDGRREHCKECEKKIKQEKRDEKWKLMLIADEARLIREEKRKSDTKKKIEEKRKHAELGIRICTKCKEIKDLKSFKKRKLRLVEGPKPGFAAICKKCYSKEQVRYAKERKRVDPAFKLKCSLRTRITNMMAQYVKTGIKEPKSGSAVRDLGCSIEDFCKYIESLWQSGMSWDNYGNKEGQWSLDHIFPLSRIDLTDREQFLRANHYTNLQPMWHIENIIKSDKLLSNLIY
jgi:hypothetical protein